MKFPLSNPTTYSVVAMTSTSSTYQAQNIYVDSNGTIYSAESWVGFKQKSSNDSFFFLFSITIKEHIIIEL